MQRAGAAIAAIGLTIWSTLASAQTADEVGAWLDKQGSGEVERAALHLTKFEFSLYQFPQMSASSLEELGHQLENHPDHPRRSEYENQKEIQRLGKVETKVVAWVKSEDEWRLSRTYLQPSAVMPWFDVTVRTGVAWTLSTDRLTIVEPSSGYPPNQDFSAFSSEWILPARRMLTCSLSSVVKAGSKRGPVFIDGDKWSASYVRPELTIEYHGTWAKDLGRGFIDGYRITASSDSDDIGKELVCEQWENVAPVGWVARRVIDRNKSGEPNREYQFTGATEVSDIAFDEATALPTAGGADPIRGAITVSRVFDFRPGIKALSFPKEPDREHHPLAQSSEHETKLRWAGWAVACGLAIGLVLLVRRRIMRN